MGNSPATITADRSEVTSPHAENQSPSGISEGFAGVEANAASGERLTSIVERRLAAGRDESALAWARVTAAFETTNPTGDLRNVRVEKALDAVARRALGNHGPRRTVSDPATVLHVLSESHLIGERVRMAARWASIDYRQSRFVITRPGLHRVAAHMGTTVDVLAGPSMLGRAAQLRAHAASADVMVCHTHGEDPVPTVAFGGNYSGAPVVMVNHADHVFWLGVGNVSTTAQLRRTGADVTADAWGYPRQSFASLPIPMDVVTRNSDRRSAKQALGLDPDRVVALTLARPTKYARSDFHPGFLDVVEPVFAETDALLLAVGPSVDHPEWAAAADRLGDRAWVVGLLSDPNSYLDAADVYLDSFPFCSNTSMLEAATRGLPIVTSRQHRGLQRLHGSEGVLDGAVIGPVRTREYREVLAPLLVDGAARSQAGLRSYEAMLSEHGPEAWSGMLEGVYRHATAAEPMRERIEPSGTSANELREYAAVLRGIESANPLMWTLKGTLESFDRRDRRALRGRLVAARAVLRARGAAPTGTDLARLLLPRSSARGFRASGNSRARGGRGR